MVTSVRVELDDPAGTVSTTPATALDPGLVINSPAWYPPAAAAAPAQYHADERASPAARTADAGFAAGTGPAVVETSAFTTQTAAIVANPAASSA